MQLHFDSFADLEIFIIRKHEAYEELKDENRQLEMDRMRMSDRIAELEEELFKVRQERDILKGDCVPNMLKRKATAENSD